ASTCRPRLLLLLAVLLLLPRQLLSPGSSRRSLAGTSTPSRGCSRTNTLALKTLTLMRRSKTFTIRRLMLMSTLPIGSSTSPVSTSKRPVGLAVLPEGDLHWRLTGCSVLHVRAATRRVGCDALLPVRLQVQGWREHRHLQLPVRPWWPHHLASR